MTWGEYPVSTASLATSQGTISGNMIAIAGVLGSQTLTDGISLAQGDLVIASNASTLIRLAKNTTDQRVLDNQGTGNNPTWNQVDLTVGVTGTLPIANGGTETTDTTFCDLGVNVSGILPIANGGTASAEAANAANGVCILGADGYLEDDLVDTSALKTADAEYSDNDQNANNYTVTGGQYCFWPQCKISASADAGVQVAGYHGVLNFTSTSYITNVTIWGAAGKTMYAKFMYVTSSGLDYWIWLKVDKKTKDIISAVAAPDHPSYGNGGNPEKTPHPFIDIDRNKYDVVLLDKKITEKIRSEEKQTGKSILTLINEEYKVDMSSTKSYAPLHSGKFLKQKPVLIKSIPDYIKVRSLVKMTSDDKANKQNKINHLTQLDEMKKQEKVRNKDSALSKLKSVGLTNEEIEALK